MEWDEISRRLRNGTSVSVLAELAGTTYKNMYNRIRRREQIDGKQYLKPDQLKRPYKAQGGRKKAASVPEKPERVTLSVAIEKGYNCMNCDNLMRVPADRNLDGALFKMICAKAGTESPDKNTCCCNYVPMPNDKKLPEILQKKLNIPEVEPIGEEKAPDVPEVVEKVADVPEVVREFSGIPPYSCLTCVHRGFNEDSCEFVCMYNHEYCEGRGCCSDYKEKTMERKLMPETIEEILTMYKQCCELADRYKKQAEDWARIMDVLQLEERNRIRRGSEK